MSLPKLENAPTLLDLFCCAGGAAMGYYRAGFNVVGVDIDPQPRYPFEFHQADALDFLAGTNLDRFDAIHASPPCQAFSNAQRIRAREHPDLITPVRAAMQEAGKPYVIENVEGARGELHDPVMLCGRMFPLLAVYRHRLFECSFAVTVPDHPRHDVRQTKMGRAPVDGEFMHVVGNFSGVERAKRAMGIDWMSRDKLREAIPPAYTEYIGAQLIKEVQR